MIESENNGVTVLIPENSEEMQRLAEYQPYHENLRRRPDKTKQDITKAIGDILKERVYVESPEEVPEGVEPQEGEQGGLYYETEDVTGEGSEEAPWSDATFEELGDVLIPVLGEDAVAEVAESLPESASVDDTVAVMEEHIQESIGSEYSPEDLRDFYTALGEAFGAPGVEEEEGSEDEGEEDGNVESPQIELPDGLTIDDAVEAVADVAGDKAAYMLFGDMKASDQGEVPDTDSYVERATVHVAEDKLDELGDRLEQRAEEPDGESEEVIQDIPDSSQEAVETILNSNEWESEEDLQTAQENWSNILDGAVENVSGERVTAVQEGLNQVEENEDFQSLLEAHDVSPSVIVADPEKLNENAGHPMFQEEAEAERKAGVTWMHDHPMNTTETEPEKPEPGEHVSSGDVGSVLRHEMTHDVWGEMDTDFRQWFMFEGLPDQEAIEEGLTEYATGRPEEAFTELITVTTHPKYDPDDYPRWVNELSEDVKERVRGEKDTEFDIHEYRARNQKSKNERRKSYVATQNLQRPEGLTKTQRKTGEHFELVDDLLMEAFEKQIWCDDIQKAPNMWRRDDEVPQFVRSHVQDAIEEADVMWGDYDDIPQTASLKVHEIISDSLTQPQGWSIKSVTKNLLDEFPEMKSKTAETITRTEIAAILNKARELAYEAAVGIGAVGGIGGGLRPEGAEPGEVPEVGYYWSGPQDHATTKVCEETKEEIHDRGGYVSKDTLKDILYRKAKKYEGTREGGTPARVSSFIPHYQCRHTFIREDYQSVT